MSPGCHAVEASVAPAALDPPDPVTQHLLRVASTVPGLSGLDVHDGVRRAMNMPDFYLEILRQVLASHGQAARSLRAALACGEWAAARRVAHDVKATAGMIGAHGLAAHAAELEKALVEDRSAATVDRLVSTFCDGLDLLVPGLARLLGAFPEHAARPA